MNPERARHRFALAMLVLACAGWGVSFPASKALALLHAASMPGESSWFYVGVQGGVRFLVAAALMALWWLRGRTLPLRPREIEQGLALALTGCLGMSFQVDGLQFTTASTSAFLTQSYCIALPVWHCLTHRRRPTVREGVAVLLVLAGAAVLARIDPRTFRIGRGETETLVSALFFTGQILALENRRYAANRASVVSTVMFLATGLGFSGLAAVANQRPAAFGRVLHEPLTYVLFAALVFLCTLGSFNLMNRFQPRVSAVEAGLIYTFEPLFASCFALFLPGLFSRWDGSLHYADETLSASLAVGGTLIVLANVALHLRSTTAPMAPTVPAAGAAPAGGIDGVLQADD